MRSFASNAAVQLIQSLRCSQLIVAQCGRSLLGQHASFSISFGEAEKFLMRAVPTHLFESPAYFLHRAEEIKFGNQRLDMFKPWTPPTPPTSFQLSLTGSFPSAFPADLVRVGSCFVGIRKNKWRVPGWLSQIGWAVQNQGLVLIAMASLRVPQIVRADSTPQRPNLRRDRPAGLGPGNGRPRAGEALERLMDAVAPWLTSSSVLQTRFP